ncbi:unnamed protein product [Didymodactylos carnosus]|uniref:Uncharacterized protein n=1 Tax=Didymodactylos carnosus TaxID=1234261 RepID=A0A816CEX6_9BILA|nr:unnamed protein product [Didymodactylos carnosus]CAF1621894.1 unnamed protein product [Didymodactylos carnosus]CAF4249499.1 unnamed protein product [Didymodactylos carnosus]CAF4512906.1 unnamed protein product [Didymodactylos carnosus]
MGLPENHTRFKDLCRKLVQPLENMSAVEDEIDVPVMEDEHLLENLRQTAYRLDLYTDEDNCLQFINANPDKKIFLAISGSMGQTFIPKIFDLPQIEGFIVYCGNKQIHGEWAKEYVEKLKAIVDFPDDFLYHMAKSSISDYLETKGDNYMAERETFQAKNCYAWSKKLLIRAGKYGKFNINSELKQINKKIERAERGLEEVSQS